MKPIVQMNYEKFKEAFVADPVSQMEQAAERGMNLAQYSNAICPEVLIEEKRSLTNKLAQDANLQFETTSVSLSSPVRDFVDAPWKEALLWDVLQRSYYGQRSGITMEGSGVVGSPLLPFSSGQPRPVAVGLGLNPSELVAVSHQVDSNNYQSLEWDYDESDMQRVKVAPGTDVPATTLKESSDVFQMSKWGVRFALPYETLINNNTRVNKLASMMQLEGLTEQNRMFVELCDVIENGEPTTTSTSRGASIAGISTFGGTAGTFDVIPFLNWADEALSYPFQISHILMRKPRMRDFRTKLAALTGNLALTQLSSIGLSPDLERMDDFMQRVRFGRVPDDAISNENRIIGLDNRAAIEYVARQGMAVREQANEIKSQTRQVVISDTYLWAKLNLQASHVLNVAA